VPQAAVVKHSGQQEAEQSTGSGKTCANLLLKKASRN